MYAIGYVLGFYRSVNVKLMEELRLGRFFIKTPLTEVERGYLTTGRISRKSGHITLLGMALSHKSLPRRLHHAPRSSLLLF